MSWIGGLRSFSARLAYSWQRPTKHDPYDAPESITNEATRPRAAQPIPRFVEDFRYFSFIPICHTATSASLPMQTLLSAHGACPQNAYPS